jgi:hypothetical protein
MVMFERLTALGEKLWKRRRSNELEVVRKFYSGPAWFRVTHVDIPDGSIVPISTPFSESFKD